MLTVSKNPLEDRVVNGGGMVFYVHAGVVQPADNLFVL
jgi:ribosomal protein L16/L10AE